MLLLTGATGFLGAAFYLDAVARGQGADCLLLIRGENEDACRARLFRQLSRFVDDRAAKDYAGLCHILPGDLLSLSATDDARLDAVREIVHVAADTSFESRSNVWRVNVDGTLALARRAQRMKRLRRFLHVGTAFCCGETARLETLAESQAPGPDTSHIVDYTRSKAAAEVALQADFDLPLVICRPSIVVGHTVLGVRPSASIFWFLRLIDRTGVLPCSRDGGIDIVPVDWVSARLHDLLAKPHLEHRIYHLSAGAGSRTGWAEFEKAFAVCGEKRGDGFAYFDPRTDGWAPFDAAFRASFPARNALHRTMMSGARKYHRFTAMDVAFDNARLLGEGCPPPPRFTDYLGICLASSRLGIGEQFLDDMGSFSQSPPDDMHIEALTCR